MKGLYFSIILLFFSFQVYCQKITGYVFDASNKQPLEYASVGVIGTSIGMITNEEGQFILNTNGVSDSALLRISMIGYKALVFNVKEIKGKNNLISLEREPIQLSEVLVKPGRKSLNIGNVGYSKRSGVCGWGGIDFGRGNEIGLKISLGSQPAHLQSLHILVSLNSFDTSLFRLHIRNLINKFPGNELLKQNILLPFTTKSGWADLDLTPFNLVFSGDIVVSLEWLKVKNLNNNRLIKMNGAKQPSANVLFKVKKSPNTGFYKWGTESQWHKDDQKGASIYLTVQ
jgi:hypothetical protein